MTAEKVCRIRAESRTEFIVYSVVLPQISARYPIFEHLQIPQIIAAHGAGGTLGYPGDILMPWYDGDIYSDRWSSDDGGKKLSTELAYEMVTLVEDLSKIDTAWFSHLLRSNEVGVSIFDVEGWATSITERQDTFLSLGMTSEEQEIIIAQARAYLRNEVYVVSNGDFYPGNIVRSRVDAGRFILLDWQYHTGYRACYIDIITNVLAFAYIHMWGNPEWRRLFLAYALERLCVRPEAFWASVSLKALEQAAFLFEENGAVDLFSAAMVDVARDAMSHKADRDTSGDHVTSQG